MRAALLFQLALPVVVLTAPLALAQVNVIEAPREYERDRLRTEQQYRTEPTAAQREEWRIQEARDKARFDINTGAKAVKDTPIELKHDVYRPYGGGTLTGWARENWKVLCAFGVLIGGCVLVFARK